MDSSLFSMNWDMPRLTGFDFEFPLQRESGKIVIETQIKVGFIPKNPSRECASRSEIFPIFAIVPHEVFHLSIGIFMDSEI